MTICKACDGLVLCNKFQIFVSEALEQDVKPSVSVSPATTAGVEETLTTCTTPTKKNKKERHKKKRKREALEALSESHPLKKVRLYEVEREF